MHSQDLNKLDVKPHCLNGSPAKEHKKEVVQQGRADATQDRNGCDMTTDEEKDIDSHQCQAQVDQNFTMNTSSLLPIIMLKY